MMRLYYNTIDIILIKTENFVGCILDACTLNFGTMSSLWKFIAYLLRKDQIMFPNNEYYSTAFWSLFIVKINLEFKFWNQHGICITQNYNEDFYKFASLWIETFFCWIKCKTIL
jgi:hypothetical protein